MHRVSWRNPRLRRRGAALGALLLAAAPAIAGGEPPPAPEPPAFLSWAPTPPMGWNSWDCFATTVTEAQAKAEADAMAARLKAHGWQYVVVDIQWYEPGANGFAYRAGAPLEMDAFGRLLPAPNRFPSARGGAGFRPLADYVHGLGLKFGIHLMRGIPREAVARNLPVAGTPFRARDIANPADTCPWNPDMFGVDMTKPGAQAYYDSVFALIASWGVDFVKVDDLSRPYWAHRAEIEAIRRAIDRAGRPIVLSLSPGETPLDAAAHVAAHANLWRISDDFWDSWPALREQFGRLARWNPHRRPGAWPDADMLPLGTLALGERTTNFTPEEQTTLLTLWSIARSPLMLGADLTRLDDATLALVTNDEVLAVNQRSAGNRPCLNRDDWVAWTADAPGTPDRYLAVFNLRDRIPLRPETAAFRSGVVSRQTPGHAVPIAADISGAARLFLAADDAGDGNGWDHAVWIEPTLVRADGSTLKLTGLPWRRATAGWGRVAVGRAPGGRAITVEGRTFADGIGAHAPSLIEYELPPGIVRFRAEGAIDDGALTQPGGATVRFLVHAVTPGPESAAPDRTLAIRLDDIGLAGPVRVRDLWSHQDLGLSSGELTLAVPWHGARLLRLAPVAVP